MGGVHRVRRRVKDRCIEGVGVELAHAKRIHGRAQFVGAAPVVIGCDRDKLGHSADGLQLVEDDLWVPQFFAGQSVIALEKPRANASNQRRLASSREGKAHDENVVTRANRRAD